jgi:4-hydroxy-tetrahydrodipicolinate synthase
MNDSTKHGTGKLAGVFVVTTTPLLQNGEIDIPGLASNADWLVSKGVDGIVALGSTGEFASLDDGQKDAVMLATIKAVDGRIPVIVGATAETTRKTIENALKAKKGGASAVLILPPYYYRSTQEEIYDHYRRVAEAVDIPIMIYNNPESSKVDISAKTVARLAKIPTIRYIKESSGDIRRITEIRMLTDDTIDVFCGSEDMSYESFRMGAKGWVCVIGNILPKSSARLFAEASSGDVEGRGWKLYEALLPWLRYLERAGKTQKALKYVLDRAGLKGGLSFSPKLPLTDVEKTEIDRLMEGVAALD